MKTKIFISSSSGANFIPHSHGIKVLPDVISINNDVYEDYKELSIDNFLGMVKLRKLKNINVLSQDKEEIKKEIKNAEEKEYKEFLFLTPPNIICDYDDKIKDIQEENKKKKIYEYKSTLISYLYFQQAQIAENMLKNGKKIKDILPKLNKVSNPDNSFLIFLCPKKDIKEDLLLDEKKALALASKAEIKVFSNGKFVTVKPPKRENPLTYFIRLYGEHIRERNITPFLVYTNKKSYLKDYSKNMLKPLFPRLKKYDEVPLSPALVKYVGLNAFGIGFISKDI